MGFCGRFSPRFLQEAAAETEVEEEVRSQQKEAHSMGMAA